LVNAGPAPNPDGEKLLDSAIVERDYDSLPGLSGIETNMETDLAPEAPAETEVHADSATSGPSPASEPALPFAANATPCNPMQHVSQNCDDVAPAPSPAARRHGLSVCPAPPEDLKARNDRKYLELLELVRLRRAEAHTEDPAANEEDIEEIVV